MNDRLIEFCVQIMEHIKNLLCPAQHLIERERALILAQPVAGFVALRNVVEKISPAKKTGSGTASTVQSTRTGIP